jgi:thiamine biosynthesis protein ThiI
MTVILVRYAEIALKGSNRPLFEAQLQENMLRRLNFPPAKVKRYHTQFAIYPSREEVNAVLENLKRVFGIAWYAAAQTCETSLSAIIETGLEVAKDRIRPDHSFAIRAQRSEKNLPFTSVDIERELGDAVRQATGAQVDLEDPEKVVYVSASTEGSYIYTEKIPGPGGLPVGSSGKVLSLLSGGTDSIVSSYYLARRGAQVDFLHFHVFPDKQAVLDSKIERIASKLAEYTFSNYLYLSSYLPFDMHILANPIREAGYELVIFRRVMVMVAAALAQKHDYQAIVLGDSLGQVASQTMENMVAVDEAVSIPIFRPLVGMDKVEIMDKVREMGLFEEAAAPYKDCCSIIAPNPVIKAYLPFVHTIERDLNINTVVNEMVDQVEKVTPDRRKFGE